MTRNFTNQEARDVAQKHSRQRIAAVDHKAAVCTMKDLRGGLTEEQIKKEADRCLGCGISILDPWKCIGCGICYTRCEFDAIHLSKRVSDAQPKDSVEEYMQMAGAYAMKRAENLAAKGAAASNAGVGSFSHMQHGRQGE